MLSSLLFSVLLASQIAAAAWIRGDTIHSRREPVVVVTDTIVHYKHINPSPTTDITAVQTIPGKSAPFSFKTLPSARPAETTSYGIGINPINSLPLPPIDSTTMETRHKALTITKHSPSIASIRQQSSEIVIVPLTLTSISGTTTVVPTSGFGSFTGRSTLVTQAPHIIDTFTSTPALESLSTSAEHESLSKNSATSQFVTTSVGSSQNPYPYPFKGSISSTTSNAIEGSSNVTPSISHGHPESESKQVGLLSSTACPYPVPTGC